jgi:hypothetical protein
MTVNALRQAQQVRAASYGPQIISPAQVAPTVSGNLWTVAGGSISITSLIVVVTTVFTATATTLNVGTAGGATTLLNAGVLTSLGVGAVVVGIPILGTPVVAAAGFITWIASAGNTGQVQVYLSYLPLDTGASVG